MRKGSHVQHSSLKAGGTLLYGALWQTGQVPEVREGSEGGLVSTPSLGKMSCPPPGKTTAYGR